MLVVKKKNGKEEIICDLYFSVKQLYELDSNLYDDLDGIIADLIKVLAIINENLENEHFYESLFCDAIKYRIIEMQELRKLKDMEKCVQSKPNSYLEMIDLLHIINCSKIQAQTCICLMCTCYREKTGQNFEGMSLTNCDLELLRLLKEKEEIEYTIKKNIITMPYAERTTVNHELHIYLDAINQKMAQVFMNNTTELKKEDDTQPPHM